MDRSHVFRRVFHFCAPFVLVYYLIPDSFFMPREWLVLIILFGLLCLEAARLSAGWVFFGLREYERGQVSALAWGGTGVAIALLLFPMPFVICSVFGMSWIDPLIGEMRKRKLRRIYPMLPLAAYFSIAVSCLILSSDIGLMSILVLGFVGSMTAIAVENPKLPIDDDFLMLMVPLATITLAHEYMAVAGLTV